MKERSGDVIELVRRAQDGDEQAIAELITIHKGLVYTVIFRMLNDYDLAQDLTQETFIKAFFKIKKLKYRKKFRSWLCTIARNLVYDHLRKQQRKKTVSLEEIGERRGSANLKKRRRQMIIQDALSTLSDRDRMLLTLSYFQGFTMAEVSEIMKIPVRNVKVYLHRARLRLREQLKGHEDEILSV